MASLITDIDLAHLIDNAEFEDIAALIDYVTDQGKGRVSLASETLSTLILSKEAGYISPQSRALLVEVIKRYGGHTVMNFFRGGEGVAYREIVRDVASHMDVKTKNDEPCGSMEATIVMVVLKKAFDDMTEEQRDGLFKEFGGVYKPGAGPAAFAVLQGLIKAYGFGAFKVTLIVVNALSKAILGRGLALAGNAALMRSIGVFAGPIGWAVTAVWTIFDLGSPAYRVTVPCVLHIAYMRQKAALRSCPNCATPASPSANFCGKCGTPISAMLLATDGNAGTPAADSTI